MLTLVIGELIQAGKYGVICVIRDQQCEHDRLNDEGRERVRAGSFPAKGERGRRFRHRR